MKPTSRRNLWLQAALLFALCLFVSLLHWGKVSSLWGDQARWLFEAYRSASGEVVYRDFMWQFPPLSLLLMSGAFRVMGSSFATALIVLDALSLLVVGLTWSVARRLLSARLAFVTVIAFTCAMSFEGGPNYSFFTLNIYTPALLTGTLGLLLFVWAIIAYLQTGALTKTRMAALVCGSTIGWLSKPEFVAGSLVGLALLMLFDRGLWFRTRTWRAWLRHYSGVIALSLGLPFSLYALIGSLVGFDNLMAGVSGYGAAAFICPWWPTGLSLVGVVAALGRGVGVLALTSAVRFKALAQKYGWRYLTMWLLSLLGLGLSIIYLPVSVNVNGFSQLSISLAWGYLIAFMTVMLPVVWLSLGLLIRLVFRFLRGQPLSDRARLFSVLIAIGLTLSARGLFGDVNSITPLVALASFPVWMILSVYLLHETLLHLKPAEPALWSKVVLTVVAAFGVVRLAQGLIDESHTAYSQLATKAGPIALADNQVSARVYQYVLSHSLDQDGLLDLDYGGGINFAAQRASPVFTTQFIYLAPDQKYRAADLDRMTQQPPKLIIANDLPDFNVTFGVIAPTRCTFPRFVWRPDQFAYDPAETFPLVDYIQAHYKPVAGFGGMVIFQLRNS